MWEYIPCLWEEGERVHCFWGPQAECSFGMCSLSITQIFSPSFCHFIQTSLLCQLCLCVLLSLLSLSHILIHSQLPLPNGYTLLNAYLIPYQPITVTVTLNILSGQAELSTGATYYKGPLFCHRRGVMTQTLSL